LILEHPGLAQRVARDFLEIAGYQILVEIVDRLPGSTGYEPWSL
jgi:hypothetical protein